MIILATRLLVHMLQGRLDWGVSGGTRSYQEASLFWSHTYVYISIYVHIQRFPDIATVPDVRTYLKIRLAIIQAYMSIFIYIYRWGA